LAPQPTETSPVTRARVTGVLYLVIILCGLFSELYVRAGLIVHGDAEATAGNIMASEWLCRLGFASDLVVFLSDVAVAVLLYMLLRPVSRTLALMAMAFRLVGTAIYGVNLLNYLAALLVLGGAEYLAAFEPGQLHALALWLLDVHRHGYDLGLVFFALHCLLLGWLLFRSDCFPGVLGVLMVLASLGYLTGSLTLFLFPDYEAAVAPVYAAPLVGELALCLWLMVRGVRMPAGSPLSGR
jgi:hypothetical protein